MVLSGSLIGLICVFALFLASLVLAFLDKKEKKKGNIERSRFFSHIALALFLIAFFGGVALTLTSGIQPRKDDGAMARRGSGMGSPGPMMGDNTAGSPAPGPLLPGIKKIDEAELKRLQEKVAKDPKDVASRERLGHLYLQQQDYENVFKMAHEALQSNPNSAESRVHMGMVLFAMQQPDQAVQQFNRVLESSPDNLEALLFKGLVQLQGQEDTKGAQETWEKYMKLAKPTDPGWNMVNSSLQAIKKQTE